MMHVVRELTYSFLRILSLWRPHSGVYVLMYHSVGGRGPLSVSSAEFDWQMRYLARHYDVIPLSGVVARAAYGARRPAACITFDDGLHDVYEHAAPILKKYSLPATFFITTGSIGGSHAAFYGSEQCMSITEIRDLYCGGYEIGAHTVHHPKLADISSDRARVEIIESKKMLESIIGAPIRSFAYPKGSYTDTVKKITETVGFESAVTTREGVCRKTFDRLALPRIAVDRLTGRMQFKGKLSPAVDIYEYLKKIVCR